MGEVISKLYSFKLPLQSNLVRWKMTKRFVFTMYGLSQNPFFLYFFSRFLSPSIEHKPSLIFSIYVCFEQPVIIVNQQLFQLHLLHSFSSNVIFSPFFLPDHGLHCIILLFHLLSFVLATCAAKSHFNCVALSVTSVSFIFP